MCDLASGERRAADTWYQLLWVLLAVASSCGTSPRRPAHHTRFHFAARISCACIASHSELHFQICLPCCMPHAACCMLHAPACCSCCCSLSVAEQPWGSLGRLSRHRVIAHCTNLLCNKFPVRTASPPTPFPFPPPPAAAPACVPAPAVAVFRFRFDFLALNAQRMRRLSNCNWQLATGNRQRATPVAQPSRAASTSASTSSSASASASGSVSLFLFQSYRMQFTPITQMG